MRIDGVRASRMLDVAMLPAALGVVIEGPVAGFEVGYVGEDGGQHRLPLADVWGGAVLRRWRRCGGSCRGRASGTCRGDNPPVSEPDDEIALTGGGYWASRPGGWCRCARRGGEFAQAPVDGRSLG